MEDAMDIDIDVLDIPEPTEAELEAMNAPVSAPAPVTSRPLEPRQGGDVQANKVYLRGVDTFSTDNIKAFASEHFPPEHSKIEWIDDTSVNVVYDTDELAYEALVAFTFDTFTEEGESELSPVDIRPAKKLSTHPDVNLFVRIATTADVKQPKAAERSRYYLMNPEQDPRERRRQYDSRRGGYDNRRSRDYDSKSETTKTWEESMYDDPPAAPAVPKHDIGNDLRGVQDDGMRPPPPKRRRSGDLLDNRGGKSSTSGRLRDRSASPIRDDGDGRYGFSARQRSFSPRRRRGSYDTPSANDQINDTRRPPQPRELFPSSSTNNNDLFIIDTVGSAPKELFPSHTSSSYTPKGASKELFPNRSSPIKDDLFGRKGSTGHRRSAAFDAADSNGGGSNRGRGNGSGAADLFADRMPPTSTRNGDLFANKMDTNNSRDLFAGRLTLTTRPASRNLEDRINSNGNTTDTTSGFSIKGSAASIENPGFSIRGAARGLDNPRVKELFPDRVAGTGNQGKELFADGGGGRRGAPRKRAEDLFY